MNVRSAAVLTRELKPFEGPFLSTDDPWFLRLKHQFLKYFEDWLTIIEVRLGVYELSEKQEMFISS